MRTQPPREHISSNERLAQFQSCLDSVQQPEKELFVKTGRSRTATFSVGSSQTLRIDSQVASETGHALRLGDHQRGLNWFAAGWPTPEALSAIPVGSFEAGGIALPHPEQADNSPTAMKLSAGAPDVARPLLSESEVRLLISSLEELLRADLDQTFAMTGRLADGAAQSWLVNGHGVAAAHRARSTSLRIDLAVANRSFSTYLGGGTGVLLRPRQIAQRLLDRVAIDRKAFPFSSSAATVVLAPQVIATLLGAIAGQFLHPASSGPQASKEVSIRDDPTAAMGAAWAPTDGEGVATRTTLLVENGERRAWLRPWDGRNDPSTPTTGCRYRDGWRDLPRHRCSNLVLSASATAPSELLATIDKGAYLVASDQAARITADGALLLPAVGFEVSQGSTVRPITTTLTLAASTLLAKIAAVARDHELLIPSGVAASVTAPSTLLEAVQLIA